MNKTYILYLVFELLNSALLSMLGVLVRELADLLQRGRSGPEEAWG